MSRARNEWYFVEHIVDEFEDDTLAAAETFEPIRCLPGDTVPRSGWWHFTCAS